MSAFFLFENEDDHRSRSRTALIAAAEKVADEGGVLIVDEADRYLNTEMRFPFFFPGNRSTGQGKEWLNNFIDSSRTKIIWITNSVSGVVDSTKRRFDYSLEFRDYDRSQREAMWKVQIREQGFSGRLPLQMVRMLAVEYPVNAGTIATVLKGAKRMLSQESVGEETDRVLRELLDRQLALQGGRRIRDLTVMDRRYDPEVLRLDTDRRAMEMVLTAFSGQLKEGLSGSGNMSCLFHGASGTGKSAYARYLAGKLGREILFRRASDLMDPYVGGDREEDPGRL